MDAGITASPSGSRTRRWPPPPTRTKSASSNSSGLTRRGTYARNKGDSRSCWATGIFRGGRPRPPRNRPRGADLLVRAGPPGPASRLLHVRRVHCLPRPRRRILDVRHDIGQLHGADLVRGRRVLPCIVTAGRGDVSWRQFLLLRRILGQIEPNRGLVVLLPRHSRETAACLQFHHLHVLRHGGTRRHGNRLRAQPPNSSQIRAHRGALSFQRVTAPASLLGVEEERFASLSLRRNGRLGHQQYNPDHIPALLLGANLLYPDNQLLL